MRVNYIFLCVLCDTKVGGVLMVAIGCSFDACLMSLTCKSEILEKPMSHLGDPALRAGVRRPALRSEGPI